MRRATTPGSGRVAGGVTPPGHHGRMRSVAVTVSVIAGLTLTGCAATPAGDPAPAPVIAANATVVTVVDGDTIEVRVRGQRERVRLLGIDTPETRDPRRPVMCFGREATEFLASLLPRGTPIRLALDVEARDVYGRLLAYVERATDGVFVNGALAAGGYADTLVIAPNHARAAELEAAVRDARRAGRGLWGACEGFGAPAG